MALLIGFLEEIYQIPQSLALTPGIKMIDMSQIHPKMQKIGRKYLKLPFFC
jgi:hypothetical protein